MANAKNELMNNELICSITTDICTEELKTFTELIKFVKRKYGDNGILVIATKTSFFKELIDSNYRDWKEVVNRW